MGGEYIDYTWEEIQATSEYKESQRKEEERETNKRSNAISDSTNTFNICCSCKNSKCPEKQK